MLLSRDGGRGAHRRKSWREWFGKTATSVITKVAAAGGGGYPGLLKPQALNSSHNLARGILTSTPDGWDINNSPCFTDVKPRHGEVRHFA